MRDHKTLLSILGTLLAAATLYACGSGGGGGGDPAGSTTVFGYITDNLGGYESVKLTVNSAELRHPSGRSCEIIAGPLEFDAAELGRDQIVEHVDTTTCEAGPYNRLYVELDENVTLQQTSSDSPQECKFVSYYDDNSVRPNRLACTIDPNDSAKVVCALEITGAVNLIASTRENVALDVDLKEFTVDTTPTPCEVTLKVSPVRADNKLAAGYRTSLAGTVSDLDAGIDRFTLTVKGTPYTVDYTGVTDQDGLDGLLERAESDGLRTTVRCQTIDTSTTPHTCIAQSVAAQPLKAITVKAKGTISAWVGAAQTFTLGYGAGTTLPVNYAKADELGKVEGTLADNAVAKVQLYGSNSSHFLAREVEVE
ncbi:MAG: hypothetical protein AMJ67_15355 [Betaproteobacteria bacterium SG8_41]|nr:MAG: hypothetical protein AMJ67_15355 [Betaproteobacteria bacterium SG8_41]